MIIIITSRCISISLFTKHSSFVNGILITIKFFLIYENLTGLGLKLDFVCKNCVDGGVIN